MALHGTARHVSDQTQQQARGPRVFCNFPAVRSRFAAMPSERVSACFLARSERVHRRGRNKGTNQPQGFVARFHGSFPPACRNDTTRSKSFYRCRRVFFWLPRGSNTMPHRPIFHCTFTRRFSWSADRILKLDPNRFDRSRMVCFRLLEADHTRPCNALPWRLSPKLCPRYKAIGARANCYTIARNSMGWLQQQPQKRCRIVRVCSSVFLD